MKEQSLTETLMDVLQARGITIRQFADAFDVTEKSAREWLKGTYAPTMTPWRFFRGARRLGIAPSKLSKLMEDNWVANRATSPVDGKVSKGG